MTDKPSETNTAADDTAVLEELREIKESLAAITEQMSSMIEDAIAKKDLVSSSYVDKRLERFSPTADIQTLMSNGFSALSNKIDDYAQATAQTALAHEATLNQHGKQLTILSRGHQSQQDQLSRIDAVMEIVTEGIPDIQKGIEDERLANGLLRQRVLTVEVKAEQNREKVQNIGDINKSIKQLNIDIKRNEVIMLKIEKRESDRETVRAKKADDRAEFRAHAKKQVIKYLPWILFGGGASGGGISWLAEMAGR